uniref:Uncharacterized protein n=1 Tax=Salix viminalis TaxID=40686 RepID=A0A6N2NJT3_SALVM
MAKMGGRRARLGKQEQGITTPLVAKKTDRRAGESKPEKKVKSVNFNGTPTRVLLLRNMAQAGAFFTAPNVVYCYEGKMLRCQELIKCRESSGLLIETMKFLYERILAFRLTFGTEDLVLLATVFLQNVLSLFFLESLDSLES